MESGPLIIPHLVSDFRPSSFLGLLWFGSSPTTIYVGGFGGTLLKERGRREQEGQNCRAPHLRLNLGPKRMQKNGLLGWRWRLWAVIADTFGVQVGVGP